MLSIPPTGIRLSVSKIQDLGGNVYVYKNKESGLYLALSVEEMFDSDIIGWYINETDEIISASKFGFTENLTYEQDCISNFNIDDWEIIRL